MDVRDSVGDSDQYYVDEIGGTDEPCRNLLQDEKGRPVH